MSSSFIRKYANIIILLSCMLGYSLVMFHLSLIRFYGLHASMDLANFSHVFYRLATDFMPDTTSAAPLYINQNWFAFHFSPIFYLWAPFYALCKCPENLLFLQTILITSSAWPIYITVRYLGIVGWQTLIWPLAFLFNPFVTNGLIFDFHEVAFATPIIAWAVWALIAHRRNWLVVCFILLLCCKEQYGISVAGFGLLWGWRYKEWRSASVMMIGGITACLLTVLWIMPHLGNGDHPMMMTDHAQSLSRFGWLKQSPAEQWKALNDLFFTSEIPDQFYLIHLFLTVVLLPLAAPMLLIASAGDVIANCLSLNPMMRSMSAYHNMAVIPILVVAACEGWQKLPKPADKRNLLMALCLVVLGYGYIDGPWPLPMSKDSWQLRGMRLYPVPATVLAQVGDKPLSAQPDIAAFFTERRALYPFPYGLDKVEYVVLRLDYPYDSIDYNPFDAAYAMHPPAYITAAKEFMKDPHFGVIFWQDHWVVLHHGDTDHIPSRAPLIDALDKMASKHQR